MSGPPYRGWPPELPFERPPFRADPFLPLFEQRRVFLRGRLEDETATAVAAQLMTLDGLSADPVTLHISSPGGPIEAVWTVLDVMDAMRAPVATSALGQAAGTAAAVLALGTGGRTVAAHATITLRLGDTSTECWGTSEDLAAAAERLASARQHLAERLAAASGRPVDVIAADLQHGRPLTAAEACAAGLADQVLSRPA